jgi:hypothetical protein
MKFTIIKMQHRYEFIDENKKKHSYKGYAFMDESNRCIIIVYSERRRDQMAEYLSLKSCLNQE